MPLKTAASAICGDVMISSILLSRRAIALIVKVPLLLINVLEVNSDGGDWLSLKRPQIWGCSADFKSTGVFYVLADACSSNVQLTPGSLEERQSTFYRRRDSFDSLLNVIVLLYLHVETRDTRELSSFVYRSEGTGIRIVIFQRH